jgi:hypothetical protein
VETTSSSNNNPFLNSVGTNLPSMMTTGVATNPDRSTLGELEAVKVYEQYQRQLLAGTAAGILFAFLQKWNILILILITYI